MTEIPDDILAVAEKLGRYYARPISLNSAIVDIAMAIAAERERCAKIADGWLKSSFDDEVFAAKSVADAIRTLT